MRCAEHGAVVLGPAGTHYLDEDRVEGQDPLAPFSPTAALHLRRTDGFAHVADIMVGSFYDPALDEGCAFEELICFHGGLGGPQTRPFILYPPTLTLPDRADHRRRGRARRALGVAQRAAGHDGRGGADRRQLMEWALALVAFALLGVAAVSRRLVGHAR